MHAIQDGDILFYRPKGLGRLIAWWTASPYIHCGVVRLKDGVPFVLDFSFWSGGFRETLLCGELNQYDGLLDAFRCTYAVEPEKIVAEMRNLRDRKYSIRMALHMGTNRLCHRRCIEDDADLPAIAEGLDCSAAVALAYQNAGIDLCPHLSIRHTTPGRLAESIALTKLCTLTREE